MYHPPSRRQQFIQRLALYIVMTISIASLTVVLIFVLLGYQFNKKDGRIEQGGLVQFSSIPGNASVSLDGNNFGSNTPSRATLTAGQHFVTMSLPGYNTWQKSVDVVPGSILWLNYSRLIPRSLAPKNVMDFAMVTSTQVSPDKKFIALKDFASSPSFQLIAIASDNPAASTLTIPAASYTKPQNQASQTFKLEAWDKSSRYLMVSHQYDAGKQEWLVVDTQDIKATKNITQLLGVSASKLVFSNSNSRILFGLINNELRRIDIDAATLSGPLVRNVAEFSLFDRSTILYRTDLDPSTKQRSVGYYDDGAASPRTIRTYSDNGTDPLRIAVGKYFGSMYTAIAYQSTVDILTGPMPRSDSQETSVLKTFATMTVPEGSSFLSIQTGGRFIVAEHGSSYSVYDLELGKMTTTKLKSGVASNKKLAWLDGYYISDDQSGVLRIYEFDGANQYDIMPVVPGFSSTLSANGKYLYGFSKDANSGYRLTRVQLIL